MKKRRYLSPRLWKRAVHAYGVRGLPAAAIKYTRHRSKNRHRDPDGPHHVLYGDRTDDPIEALYLEGEPRDRTTPVLPIPLSALRLERLGIRLDDLTANPFTRTVAEYLSGETLTYQDSTLRRFYATWQPATLAEFFGIKVDADRSHLTEPLHVDVLPWEPGADVAERAARREIHEASWRLKFGPSPTGSHGYSHFGPTSDAFGGYRFNKHIAVATSMAGHAEARGMADAHWWIPGQGGYLEVQLLVSGAAWAASVREGKHRTAALAALGAERIVVAIPSHYPVVRREDVASWPAVRSGLYQIEEALQVFDRFLEGTTPQASWGLGWAPEPV